MSIIIRKATFDDMPVILRQLKDSSDFYDSKYPLYGTDPVHSQMILNGLIKDHVFFVAEKEGEVIGLIAGMLLPHIYNQDIMTLTQTFWWVKEEYRHGKTGLKLLKAYTEAGEEKAKWIICTTHKHTPIKDESFIKRGFILNEKSFLKEM